MDSKVFEQKVKEMEEQIQKGSPNGPKGGGKCASTLYIIAAIIPVGTFLILYFAKPGFVQSKDGDTNVRSGKKVFWWTLLITFILWIIVYLFGYYRGYNLFGAVCLRR